MNYETQRNQKRGGSTPDDQIKRGVLPHLCIEPKRQNAFPLEVEMRLSVEPTIIADDEILDIILAGHTIDEMSMLAETTARAICRTLDISAKRADVPADILYNTKLDLKLRFTKPTEEDLEDDFWEAE